jgi:hypothetical protein
MPPRILNLGTGWMLLVSFTSRPYAPRGMSPSTYWIGRLVGPQSRSRRCWEKKKLPAFGPAIPSRPAHRQVCGRRFLQGWGTSRRPSVRYVRLVQRYCWGSTSGMLECGGRAAGFVFTDVSKECIVFIVKGWGAPRPSDMASHPKRPGSSTRHPCLCKNAKQDLGNHSLKTTN